VLVWLRDINRMYTVLPASVGIWDTVRSFFGSDCSKYLEIFEAPLKTDTLGCELVFKIL
jgi:hypothetical protein